MDFLSGQNRSERKSGLPFRFIILDDCVELRDRLFCSCVNRVTFLKRPTCRAELADYGDRVRDLELRAMVLGCCWLNPNR